MEIHRAPDDDVVSTLVRFENALGPIARGDRERIEDGDNLTARCPDGAPPECRHRQRLIEVEQSHPWKLPGNCAWSTVRRTVSHDDLYRRFHALWLESRQTELDHRRRVVCRDHDREVDALHPY